MRPAPNLLFMPEPGTEQLSAAAAVRPDLDTETRHDRVQSHHLPGTITPKAG
jgi:hypothetical protein